MQITENLLQDLCRQFGDAFYLLDTEQFEKNFYELKNSFSKIYSKFNIAYSYKTNYIPALCKIVDKLDGYAEVVSDMEAEIALRIGVHPEKIIWNGPYKNLNKVKEFVLKGSTINLDSENETKLIQKLAKENPDKILNVGIRCNFEINDGVLSRFGFDTESEEFKNTIKIINEINNIHLVGFQCHFATRSLETWAPRMKGMLDVLDRERIIPEHIDMGGGLFGKMAASLKEQFDSDIPSYDEYANVVANIMAEHYFYLDEDSKPLLLIEPGSALVGDCMSFASKVVNIKSIRGKSIATLLGSIYNINPTLNKKNPPIEVYHMGGECQDYTDLDFGGYTCIESDYIYKHYNGRLAVNDMVVFGNAGSYSVVLKPPFILPNFPVIELKQGEQSVVKEKEVFDDLFHTYVF